ncbi:DUF4097 family beta strand repeat-containing protein [Fusibacter ferrireducens]|uniref:DUF4097 family beta strand repeat protein n=1 Tax=Fusibacter ferrireducens TaxID=2785058 RepID=A0ABR9ZRW6_9FIRM|nr:DUF4097 family beta strand repeat-containing protein [Fusibacter ferrireducens]MBF4693203.1 DUF4097 family beta strand repeat protein [Fusibacter ferrireducens]
MNHKLEILKMIEAGKISVEEGLELIEAAEQTERIESDSINEEEQYTYGRTERETLKNFDVALVSCKLNIERSNVEDVTIELLNPQTRELVEKPDWLQFYEEENYIAIKEKRSGSFGDLINFFKDPGENNLFKTIFINIKLPMNLVVDQGKFSSVSGNLSAIGLNGVDFTFKTVSGKVYMTGVKAQVIKGKSTSGSVISEDVKCESGVYGSTSGRLKITGQHGTAKGKTVSGSIEFDGGDEIKEADFSTVSGKIDIKVETPEKYNLSMDSLSGGIDPSGFAVVDKDISGKRRVNVSNRSEDRWIKASTVSGKILFDKK